MSVKQSEINSLNSSQLEALIAKAEARLVELDGERIASVRDQIRDTLAKEGLSLNDLFPTRGRSTKASKGSKVAIKYRDPKNPANAWSGRGKRPNWLREAIEAGKKLESFLV